MARSPEFEEMSHHDWPADLRGLREAATLVYSAYVELDEARSPYVMEYQETWKAEYTELAGAAWALLKAIRKAGTLRLGEMEASRDV